MSDTVSSLIGHDGERWDASEDDAKRQAIASLRGYAYQLHQSLAAWIGLPEEATLHLEVAEDYTEILRDPATLDTVLAATQIKNTRESGSVTLNSPDVLAAIRHYWTLRAANSGRPVRLVFLTTSPFGRERRDPLTSGTAGLDAWSRAARGGPLDALRAALKSRFAENEALLSFLTTSDDDAIRRDLVEPVRWLCGAPTLEGVAADNRAALVVLGQSLGGTPDLSSRAADSLLVHVLTTILNSADRRLRRGDLLEQLYNAITIRVPAQYALAGPERTARGIELAATGAWRVTAPPAGSYAARTGAIAELRAAMGIDGALWLHGATGLGKSILAELTATAHGGTWRLLDLRSAIGPAARERLVAARLAILSDPQVSGLVIDDLSPELERHIEAPLAELAASLARRSMPLIVTSNHPPGQRLARALRLSDGGIHPAPSFERDDAAELVGAYGGDPAKWAWFALLVGGAHPQLVDVVIAGLARRGWPESAMRDWMSAGMKNADVEAEREAARRRLLGELEADTLGLLARTVRVYGTFDRALGLALGAVAPSLAAAGLALDQLTGHWIERLGEGRLRTSPLVSGLDLETLDEAALQELDLAIVTHILTRKSVDADLVDTAFYHAWLAANESWIKYIVQRVIGTDDDDRPKLASAMPMFRQAHGVPGFLEHRPYVILLLRLAQHLLVSAIGTPEAVAQSATALVAHLDATIESEAEVRQSTSAMILMKLLFDSYGFGRIPNWFALLRRLGTIIQDDPEFRRMVDRVGVSAEADPTGFLFVAHAARLSGTAALAGLFTEIDALPPRERDVWLASMCEPPHAMMMIVDNAWLQDAQSGDIDGVSQARVFGQLAEMALTWDEARLAGRCYRAQAVMLDEYAQDSDATCAALDAAEAQLPGNFDLLRVRAKIAWRANDYPAALTQLLALEERMAETEPLDAAFAMREAGMSAAELERWADAARLFRKGQTFVLKARDEQPSPLSIGLAADAATVRFVGSDRAGAVRAMVEVLDQLTNIDPEESLTARSVHLITRHLILWMHGHSEPVLVDGEAPAFVAGAASNPDPKSAMATLPVTALAPAWMLLGRVALDAGITPDEVLGWPGMIVARGNADLDAMIRSYLLNHAIATGSRADFSRFLIPGVEAFDYMARVRARGDEPDPLHPSPSAISTLEKDALTAAAVRGYLRDAALAFVLPALGTQGTDEPLHSLLHTVLVSAAGYDPLPEWSPSPRIEEGDTYSIVAQYLAAFVDEAPLGIEHLFAAHLRMLEWARISNHQLIVMPALATRVRRDWTQVIEQRRALLISPGQTVPALASALSSEREGAAYIAGVLLAAEPAVSISLAGDFRALLAQLIGP